MLCFFPCDETSTRRVDKTEANKRTNTDSKVASQLKTYPFVNETKS